MKTELSIAGEEGLGVREADAMVAQMCGRFAPTFDLGAFLGLSPDKRRNFVLDLCAKHGPGDAINANELTNQFQVEFLKLTLGDATVELALKNSTVDALLKELTSTQRECLSDALDEIKMDLAGEMTEAIGAALDRAKELAKQSKGNHDRARAASRELSQRKAEYVVVADSVTELQSKLSAENVTRDELIESIGNVEGRSKSLEAESLKMMNLDAAIATAQVNLRTTESVQVPTDDELAGLTDQINGLKAEREGVPVVELDELSKIESLAEAELEEAKNAVDEWDKANCDNRRKRDELEDRIRSIESGDWELAHELCEKLDEGLQHLTSKYPIHATDWNDLKVVIERNLRTSDLQNLQSTLDRLESESEAKPDLVALQDRVAELSKVFEKAHEELSIGSEHWVHRSNIDDRITRLESDYRLASGTKQSRDEQISERTQKIENLKSERIESERRHTDLLAEGAASTDELKEQLARLDTVIAALTQDIESKQKYQTLEEELTECIANAERAEVMHDTCKELQKAIKCVRELLMDELVAPLVSRIDEFLAIASPNCKVYYELLSDRDKPTFELGWIVDDVKKIPLPAMSGGEAATFGAGLAYALVTLSDSPLKLLMLEASELDSVRLGAVLDALFVVSPKLSNVFVATCHAPLVQDGSQWNVIDPSAATVAA